MQQVQEFLENRKRQHLSDHKILVDQDNHAHCIFKEKTAHIDTDKDTKTEILKTLKNMLYAGDEDKYIEHL